MMDSMTVNVNASAIINENGKYDVFFDFKGFERRVVYNVVAASEADAELLVSQGYGIEDSKYVESIDQDENDDA